MSQYAYFSELPVGCIYSRAGNVCRKQSSRTEYIEQAGRWFYAGQSDLCIVGLHSRLPAC